MCVRECVHVRTHVCVVCVHMRVRVLCVHVCAHVCVCMCAHALLRGRLHSNPPCLGQQGLSWLVDQGRADGSAAGSACRPRLCTRADKLLEFTLPFCVQSQAGGVRVQGFNKIQTIRCYGTNAVCPGKTDRLTLVYGLQFQGDFSHASPISSVTVKWA